MKKTLKLTMHKSKEKNPTHYTYKILKENLDYVMYTGPTVRVWVCGMIMKWINIKKWNTRNTKNFNFPFKYAFTRPPPINGCTDLPPHTKCR